MSHGSHHSEHPPTLFSLFRSLQKGIAMFLSGIAIASLGGMQMMRAFANPQASWLLIAVAALIAAYLILMGLEHVFEEMMEYAEATAKPAKGAAED